ncbi:MAG: 50S ribosomal protein L9 [Gemmatimonadetes bacterium]|jgi:large subunit ribosomal protein L9|nr:50S ribosomal protein L9 [Gemmatimonadota bacterium]
MKLILKKPVESLGDAGDIVTVKAGYGRNYLIPQGLAYEASSANIRRLEEEQRRAQERSRRDYLEAHRRAAQLAGMSLLFHARAGEDGKLFGSVTNADVADRANESGKLDFELDKRSVVMEEPLKSLGVFAVSVHFHAEVDAEIEVRVERAES